MKKLYLILLLVIGTLVGASAQTPTFVLTNTAGDPGSVVSVDFSVRDFTNLVGMQFSINWDPTVLSFKELKNITGSLRDFDEGAFNLDSRFTTDGVIIVSWFDQSAEPNSVDDGTILFTVDFDVVGGSGSGTTITISDEPRRIEVIDSEENNVGLNVEGGVFGTGGGGGPGNLRFIGSDEQAEQGEEVCVDVSVDGFANVSGMQFSLNWDASFLQFVGVGGFNLSGLNDGSFNLGDVNNGKLVLQWLDPNSSGVTLADGTQLFEICFTVLGANGSRNVTFSNDPVNIEVVDGNDEVLSFTKKDGTVTVGDGGGGMGRECEVDGFAMIISEEAPQPNTEACFDVSIQGFESILSLAGTVEWDNTVLANPSVENITLAGLGSGNFNLDQGANGLLSFVWVETTTDGLSLPDNEVIFQLCFDAIGALGSTTNLTFTDGITPREVNNTSTALDFGQCDGFAEIGGTSTGSVSTSITLPCPGEANGVIDATVSGGNGPFTFAWSQGGTQVGSSEDLMNIGSGAYVLVVTDADGNQLANMEVNVGEAIEITNSDITDATDGNANGSVDITVTGGGLVYAWSNGDNTEDLNNVLPGTFMVTITDNTGCQLTETFTVGGTGGELDFELVFDDFNGSEISCNGECDAMITANATGGSGGYTYAWSNGETSPTVAGLCAGEIGVTVTDSDGNAVSRTRVVVEPEEIMVTVSTTPAPNNVEGTALAQVIGGTEPYTYRWNDDDPPSTTRLINNLPQGRYTVIVTDANGCQGTASGDVSGTDQECFTGRLVITPNADGLNDVFAIACASGSDNELEIYDRHGELVFAMDNYDNSWQGIENDGDELPDGGYFWVLRVRSGNGLEQYTGHVTILRRLN